MAQFRLWGRIETMGPSFFRVIVAAVPAAPGYGPQPHDIHRAFTSSRFVADVLREALSQRVRDVVAARGDAIREIA